MRTIPLVLDKQLENLKIQEKILLFETPCLLAIYVASADQYIEIKEKMIAIKLIYLESSCTANSLQAYYNHVLKHFGKTFEKIIHQYSPFNLEQRTLMQKELEKLPDILAKLEPEFGKSLSQSLSVFARNITKIHTTETEDFIFPFPIAGLA